MKVKKLLASTLVASMVVSGVASLNVNNEVSATTQKVAQDTLDQVDVLTPYVSVNDDLKTNANASSYQNGTSGDGKPALAFDNVASNHWHTRYNGSGTGNQDQIAHYNRNTDQKAGGDATKSQWIQTGFANPTDLVALGYISRINGENNHIREYEVYVSTQNDNPSNTETTNTSVWTKAAEGKFAPSFSNDAERLIRFSSQQKNVKWVRLVAKNVWGANGYVTASKINLYTAVTKESVNLNEYRNFWEKSKANGTLGSQDETDRWVFEVKENDQWSNNTKFNGNYWLTGSNGSIGKDGFRNDFSPKQANAVSWVAPKVGYYKFSQQSNPGTVNLSSQSGKIVLTTVDAKGQDIKTLETFRDSRTFTTEAQLLEKGAKFRYAAMKNNESSVINYCDFNRNSGHYAPWVVTDVTKEVAAQKITEATALKDNQANVNKAESAKQALTDAISKLETAKQGNDNAAIVAAVDALAKATNQFNNDKLFDLATKASTYKWTDTTAQAAQQAIQTALDASATVLTNQQDAIVILSRALNKATRLYDVDVLVDGVKSDVLSFKDVYNKANTTTISAPATKEGKGDFVGWYKKKGDTYLYEVKDAQKLNLDVVASNDVTYEAVYETAPSVVNTNVGIEMQNSYVSQSGNTYSAKFVGKYFNLPQDATSIEFGLKWGKDGAALKPVKFNSSANKHQQFSLTVNGLTEGHSVTGQVYVKYTTADGQTVEKTSEQVTLYI